MPSHRITVISNAKQTQRATLLVAPTNTPAEAIFKAAKDKLRFKKPTRIFLPGGQEVTSNVDLHDGEYLVSCGEDYIGIRKTASTKCPVRVIAKTSYVDPLSLNQLDATATLPGMVQAVGMPDLHPGTKSPVGAVFISTNIHPPLIGGDIGCGMAVYQTNFKDLSDDQVKRIADRLSLEGPWPEANSFLAEYLSAEEIEQVKVYETSLGTIGAGNHFAELQQITKSESDALPDVVLVVHSGSRGLGQQILKESEEIYSPEDAVEYLRKHDIACRWAKANRDLIAFRFLGYRSVKILDIWHNNVTKMDDTYIHRKGAAPATTDLVIIPGSRGTLSAYVRPISTPDTAYSLAHGAGRATSRAAAAKKLSQKYRPEDLKRTSYGWVICDDKQLIYEEAPQAYKDVEAVVADLVDAGACKVVAWGMPRLSYKIKSV